MVETKKLGEIGMVEVRKIENERHILIKDIKREGILLNWLNSWVTDSGICRCWKDGERCLIKVIKERCIFK